MEPHKSKSVNKMFEILTTKYYNNNNNSTICFISEIPTFDQNSVIDSRGLDIIVYQIISVGTSNYINLVLVLICKIEFYKQNKIILCIYSILTSFILG